MKTYFVTSRNATVTTLQLITNMTGIHSELDDAEEERARKFFMEALHGLEKDNAVEDVLMFCTGLKRIPPTGLIPKITFNSSQEKITNPRSLLRHLLVNYWFQQCTRSMTHFCAS
eukprot:Seg693.5 transcript_id=Seg693.5/GoldUCD/mRNA.D3Y31 product="hypothetical protein" protein_id=Seg693.5/GoldUCD/D3Y31